MSDPFPEQRIKSSHQSSKVGLGSTEVRTLVNACVSLPRAELRPGNRTNSNRLSRPISTFLVKSMQNKTSNRYSFGSRTTIVFIREVNVLWDSAQL